jgi:hypothetical protein
MKMLKLNDDEDKKKVIRDGEVVTMSMSLMDSTQKAVAAFDAVAARQRIVDAHEKYRRDISNRWRGAPAPNLTASPSPMKTVTTDAATAYRVYDQTVANRWRTAS